MPEKAGGYEQVVCADAAGLPWADGEYDLAVAFMSLHDMPHPAAVIGEIARVLAPGGVLAVAIVHPLNRPVEHLREYFDEHRVTDVVTRNELTMTFNGVDRPLETYTRALASHGFVIDQMREPRASAAAARSDSELAPAAKRPYFLHLRCGLH